MEHSLDCSASRRELEKLRNARKYKCGRALLLHWNLEILLEDLFVPIFLPLAEISRKSLAILLSVIVGGGDWSCWL